MVHIKANSIKDLGQELVPLEQEMTTLAYQVFLGAKEFKFLRGSSFEGCSQVFLEQLNEKPLKAVKAKPFCSSPSMLRVHGECRECSLGEALSKISNFFTVIGIEKDFYEDTGGPLHVARFNRYMAIIGKHLDVSKPLRAIEYLPFRGSYQAFTTAWDYWVVLVDTHEGKGLELYLSAAI